MKKKYILSVLLAAAMFFTACGQGNSSGGDTAATKANNEATEKEEKTDSKDTTAKEDTPSAGDIPTSGKIDFPLDEPVTLTAFVLHAQAIVDMTDNYITELIREETNITLDFKHSVAGDDGKTKLNLLMASDDLPDIFLRTGWSKAEALLYGSQGLIIPIQDYLKDAELWNSYNIEWPARLPDLIMTDGNIYNYGGASGENHGNYHARMWVYKPWIDSLMDGKMPETIDEYYEFLTKVKNEDPNGNGQADEIPLSGSIAAGQWATDPTTFLLNSFLQTNTHISNTNPTFNPFMVNDGTIEFQFTKDAYRDGLAFLNKLYKEGLMDSQIFTQDGTQLTALASGDVPRLASASGGYFGSFMNAASFNEEKIDGTWDSWALLSPLKGPDGVQYSYYQLTNYFGNGWVSRSCENPNLAVQLFDFMTTPDLTIAQQYGPKDIGWEFVDGGTGVDGGTATWRRILAEKFTEAGEPDWGLGYAQNVWPSDINIGALGLFKAHELVERPEVNLEYILYQALTEYAKYRPELDSMVPNFAFSEDQAREISEFMVSIGSYCIQARVQFITGDLSIENDWDSYLQKLDDVNLERFIQIYQEAYDAYAASQN